MDRMPDRRDEIYDQLHRKYIALHDAAVKLRAAQLAYIESRDDWRIPMPERVRRRKELDAACEQMDVLLLK